jgi:hypothetical protein
MISTTSTRRDGRQLLKALFITILIYALFGVTRVLPSWMHGTTGLGMFIVLVFTPLSIFLVAWPRLRDDCQM